ncbi:MAG: threonine/serine ThrE exporter family protein [Aeromicrobium sp.]
MDRTTDAQRTLDLALRVGEMLLSNGAGAADVTATMSSIAHHLGLRQSLVDVTFTTLVMSHQVGAEEPVVEMRRQVTHRENDYADLTAVDHLVSELLDDEITRAEAAAHVLQMSSSGHPTPRWAVTASWGVTGAGVALLLGGDWIVMLIAAISGAGIEMLQRRLARLRLPFFYSQVAGGCSPRPSQPASRPPTCRSTPRSS